MDVMLSAALVFLGLFFVSAAITAAADTIVRAIDQHTRIVERIQRYEEALLESKEKESQELPC